MPKLLLLPRQSRFRVPHRVPWTAVDRAPRLPPVREVCQSLSGQPGKASARVAVIQSLGLVALAGR